MSGSENVPSWDEPAADERAEPARHDLRDFSTEQRP